MTEFHPEPAFAPEGSDLVKAKSDALRLLSFKPRSVRELEDRLKRKKYAPALVEKVIEGLKGQGLLDDEKFARLLAHSTVYSRPMGKKRLEFDLSRKGLSKDTVQKTLDSLGDYDEKKAARDLVFGRFQKMTGVSDEKKKARLFAFLRRRGFSTETIFSALSNLFSATKRGGSAFPPKDGSAESFGGDGKGLEYNDD